MIIDAHLHLDEKFDGTAFGAARELDRQLAAANVDGALVLHLETQPWSLAEVSEAVARHPRLKAFANIHPYSAECVAELRYAIEKLGFVGLKLHPRLQKFDLSDERVKTLVRSAGEMGVPVLVDAFPDGTHLMQGFSPLNYSALALACPATRIICAHMGGHYVLDFMMLAKRISNLYFDMSYSLLYYRTSSVPQAMVYAMRSLKFERIFYGSDYPDRSIAVSLDLSRAVLQSQDLQTDDLARLLGTNFSEFLGWTHNSQPSRGECR